MLVHHFYVGVIGPLVVLPAILVCGIARYLFGRHPSFMLDQSGGRVRRDNQKVMGPCSDCQNFNCV